MVMKSTVVINVENRYYKKSANTVVTFFTHITAMRSTAVVNAGHMPHMKTKQNISEREEKKLTIMS